MTNAGNAIEVLVVDDHTLFREALSEMLDRVPGLSVRSAASGTEALGLLDPPDVVLLDVEIPGERATATLGRLRTRYPSASVVMLSVFDDPRTVQETLAAGAAGYLLKSVTREELVTAVRNACADPGRSRVSISRDTLNRIAVGGGTGPLSRRECEVLQLVAGAMTNGQIGARLSISEGTVKRHLRNIFVKLNAVSRIDAVNKAIEADILPTHGKAAAH